MDERPRLAVRTAAGTPRLVVLVLPGGRVESRAPVRPWNLSVARLVPFWRAIGDRPGVAAGLLRYQVRGWNGVEAAPLRDARWALHELRDRFPGVPVLLLGHSMGGRTALQLLGEPDVVAAVGLAPWLPPDEPHVPLGRTRLLIVHGTADRWTDPAASRQYVAEAAAAGGDATFVAVRGAGHFMLRRRRRWRRLVTDFLTDVISATSDRPSDPRGSPSAVPGQTAAVPAPNPAGNLDRGPARPRRSGAARGRSGQCNRGTWRNRGRRRGRADGSRWWARGYPD
ncbi:MAG TPA: alpha/beta fold hydrolase [Sporichthyaceae bacterium]|jgi:dienelactone hydrolase|nr:alpha/beta fold hydrolase [Sporichthyaceae bacterium]